MLQFRRRKYLFVLLVIIIASPFVFYLVTKLFQVPSLCGGQPYEVNWNNGHFFPGRGVRSTSSMSSDQLGLSFGDGGFAAITVRDGKYYAEECATGPAQHNGKPGNDILSLENGTYFATDETSTWLYANGAFTDIGDGISTTAGYGLYFDETTTALYQATINGIYKLVDGQWVRQDFLSAPLTSDRFHVITHVGDEWILGSNEHAGVLVYHEADNTWTRYNEQGIYRTVNGEWQLVLDTTRYPNKIRSIQLIVSGENTRVYIAADSDNLGEGLLLYENGQLTYVPDVPLHHLVRVRMIKEHLVISDYLGGTAMLTSSGWQVLTQVPSFDSAYFGGKLIVATADGIRTFDIPN